LGLQTYNLSRRTNDHHQAQYRTGRPARQRADGNLLREMIAYVAQQLMQFHVDNRCAAGRHLKGVG
jgi:hypothetical protein